MIENQELTEIDWSKSPQIIWEKAQCPFCGEPTGPSSKCFNKKPKLNTSGMEEETEVEAVSKSVIDINGEQYSLFSDQCYFRQNNNFLFHLNFPISAPLASKIGALDGIERINVHSKYRATITIGKNFNELEIKRKVTETIHRFLKEVVENPNIAESN